MGKKIIVTGGGIVSSNRAEYVSRAKVGEHEESPRSLFSATESGLKRTVANRYLGRGDEMPEDGHLSELVFSLEQKDFRKLGTDAASRKQEMEEVVREGLAKLWAELGVTDVRYIAGIHLNTGNPHAHILYDRNAINATTGAPAKVPKIPRDWFWRQAGVNSKLGGMFEEGLSKHSVAAPPKSVQTMSRKNGVFIPAREFNLTRIGKTLDSISSVNHISPHQVQQLYDNGSMYVSRQGSLTFVRRDSEGNVTGYSYQSGYQPEDAKGFFYIGDPKKATHYILVENPKEALAALELTSHRDLSEVCFVAADKLQAPAGFVSFIRERSGSEAVRVVWGLGLDRAGRQETEHYQELETALLENRREGAPRLELYSWSPKPGFGRNWSEQLQYRNLPGELKAIAKVLAVAGEVEVAGIDEAATAAYEQKVTETFAGVVVKAEKEEFVIYERTDDDGGGEIGRYSLAETNDDEVFAGTSFTVLSIGGETFAQPPDNFADELEVINFIMERHGAEQEAKRQEEAEAARREAESQAQTESAREVLAEKERPPLSAKEITERLKEIPLEDVMPRLGLQLTYDQDRREYVYRDAGEQWKIKTQGLMWCDRYDDNRGGRNALNLVMHFQGAGFAEARSFLLENFGTDYIPHRRRAPSRRRVQSLRSS